MILLDRVHLKLVFQISPYPSIKYSSHHLLGQHWHFKCDPPTNSSETHGVEIRNPTWSSTLMIPFLPFPLPLPASHRSQFTCLTEHAWGGCHFQCTETRYLMMIMSGIPDVITGTGHFIFSKRKCIKHQEYLPHLSLIFFHSPYFFLTRMKLKARS